MLRWRNVLILLVVLVAVAAVVVRTRRGAEGVEVELATATRRTDFQSFVTASGEIVATRYADIGSSLMGRLVSLPVKEGDRVKAGQLLARIDPAQAESSATAASAQFSALQADAAAAERQAESAASEVAVAESRATETRKAFTRATELRGQGLISQAEFDTAQAASDTALAQVQSAQASLLRAQQAASAAERRVAQALAQRAGARDILSKTRITAPIDGVVTRLNVEEGEMVVIGVQNQPGTILMTVSDLSVIEAEVKVAEADVLRLAVGDAATVTLEAIGETRLSGRVTEIGASALPQVGTQAAAREFRVKVRLEGTPMPLRPGLTCDAEILVDRKPNALTVPLQAVVQRNIGGRDRVGVFVIERGTARFRPVTSGIIGGLEIEVDGIGDGTAVVAGPFQLLKDLKDGDRVRPRRQDSR